VSSSDVFRFGFVVVLCFVPEGVALELRGG